MRYGLVLCILGLGLNFSAHAQVIDSTGTVEAQLIDSTNNGQRITLQDAINLALKNNFQLKVAKNNLGLSEFQEKSEKADFLPSLSSSANASKRVGRQFNNNTGDFGNFTINSLGGSVSTSIPIFNGFENIRSLRSQEYSTMSQKETVRRTRENTIFNTASNYLQVILNKELLEISKQNLKASRKTLEQVKAQVEVGARPSVDGFNQEATVANNELDVTNRENALSLSRVQLIRVIQVDPLKDYAFFIPKINVDNIATSQYDVDQVVSAALENRSDLQSAKYNIKSIEQELKIAKGSLLPSLNFNASISSNYNDVSEQPILDDNGNPVMDPNNPGAFLTKTIPFSDQFFDQNISRSFSISLNIPIFNNLTRRTNVQVQKVNYKNAKLQLQDTHLQVIQDVTQAVNDYKAVVKRLESTKKALRAAQRSYETQRERYNVGAGTLIELSDANSQFVEAQSNRAQAVFNFIFQKKLLDYYVGKLDNNITLDY